MTRLFGGSRGTVLLWAIATAVLGYGLYALTKWFTEQNLQELEPFVESTMITLMIAGMALIGLLLIRETLGRKAGLYYVISFFTALVLSTVSLATTFFGFFKFVSAQDATSAVTGAVTGESPIFPIFLAFGATLGIQLLMLVMALQLGDALVERFKATQRLKSNAGQRPNPATRERLGVEQPDAVGSTVNRLVQAGLLVLFIGFVFVAANGLGILDISEIVAVLQGIVNENFNPTEVSFSVRVLLVAVVVIIAARMLLARRSWFKLMSDLFLVAYLGALFVSWLFSFDSFFSVIQSSQTAQIERDAIVIEETSEILAEASRELEGRTNAQTTRLGSDVVTAPIDEITGALRVALNSSADELARETQINMNAKINELSEAERRLSDLESDRDQEAGEIELRSRAVATADTDLAGLTEQEETLRSSVNALEANVAKLRQEVREFRREEEAQRRGVGDRASGCGPLCTAARESAQKAEADLDFEEGQLEAQRAALSDVSSRTRTINRALAEGSEDAINRIQGDVDELDDEIDKQKAEVRRLEAELNGLRTASPNAQTRITEVDEASARFKTNPREITLAKFKEVCALSTKLESYVGPSCNVATVQAAVDLLELDLARRTQFDAECVPVLLPKTAKERVDATRDCLLQVEASSSLNNQLTQLQSVFLTSRNDVRRAIVNLSRGSQFAVGAAIVALLIDIFILIMGITVSFNKSQSALRDPLDNSIDRVEEKLRIICREPEFGGSVQVAMVRFIRTLEPAHDNDEAYPANFRADLAQEERDLIHQVTLAAGAPFMRSVKRPSLSGLQGETAHDVFAQPHAAFLELVYELAGEETGEAARPMAREPHDAARGTMSRYRINQIRPQLAGNMPSRNQIRNR